MRGKSDPWEDLDDGAPWQDDYDSQEQPAARPKGRPGVFGSAFSDFDSDPDPRDDRTGVFAFDRPARNSGSGSSRPKAPRGAILDDDYRRPSSRNAAWDDDDDSLDMFEEDEREPLLNRKVLVGVAMLSSLVMLAAGAYLAFGDKLNFGSTAAKSKAAATTTTDTTDDLTVTPDSPLLAGEEEGDDLAADDMDGTTGVNDDEDTVEDAGTDNGGAEDNDAAEDKPVDTKPEAPKPIVKPEPEPVPGDGGAGAGGIGNQPIVPAIPGVKPTQAETARQTSRLMSSLAQYRKDAGCKANVKSDAVSSVALAHSANIASEIKKGRVRATDGHFRDRLVAAGYAPKNTFIAAELQATPAAASLPNYADSNLVLSGWQADPDARSYLRDCSYTSYAVGLAPLEAGGYVWTLTMAGKNV